MRQQAKMPVCFAVGRTECRLWGNSRHTTIGSEPPEWGRKPTYAVVYEFTA